MLPQMENLCGACFFLLSKERLTTSRSELEREYERQRERLIKHHQSLLANFKSNQKRIQRVSKTAADHELNKTFVGTYHGHRGTISPTRPWTASKFLHSRIESNTSRLQDSDAVSDFTEQTCVLGLLRFLVEVPVCPPQERSVHKFC